MTKVPVKAIEQMVEYLWESERLHYMGAPDPPHIFSSVKKVARWPSTYPGAGIDWRPELKEIDDEISADAT
jgi:hypothetical protein